MKNRMNKSVKTGSRQAIENMKYEIANELGVCRESNSCSRSNNSMNNKRINNKSCK